MMGGDARAKTGTLHVPPMHNSYAINQSHEHFDGGTPSEWAMPLAKTGK
jgi:hypothetical protein